MDSSVSANHARFMKEPGRFKDLRKVLEKVIGNAKFEASDLGITNVYLYPGYWDALTSCLTEASKRGTVVTRTNLTEVANLIDYCAEKIPAKKCGDVSQYYLAWRSNRTGISKSSFVRVQEKDNLSEIVKQMVTEIHEEAKNGTVTSDHLAIILAQTPQFMNVQFWEEIKEFAELLLIGKSSIKHTRKKQKMDLNLIEKVRNGQCVYCHSDKKLRGRQLGRHLKNFHSLQNFVCIVNGCNSLFKSENYARDHFRKRHRWTKCPNKKCRKVFAGYDKFSKHACQNEGEDKDGDIFDEDPNGAFEFLVENWEGRVKLGFEEEKNEEEQDEHDDDADGRPNEDVKPIDKKRFVKFAETGDATDSEQVVEDVTVQVVDKGVAIIPGLVAPQSLNEDECQMSEVDLEDNSVEEESEEEEDESVDLGAEEQEVSELEQEGAGHHHQFSDDGEEEEQFEHEEEEEVVKWNEEGLKENEDHACMLNYFFIDCVFPEGLDFIRNVVLEEAVANQANISGEYANDEVVGGRKSLADLIQMGYDFSLKMNEFE